MMQVRTKNMESEKFESSNGLRQRGVLSPPIYSATGLHNHSILTNDKKTGCRSPNVTKSKNSRMCFC